MIISNRRPYYYYYYYYLRSTNLTERFAKGIGSTLLLYIIAITIRKKNPKRFLIKILFLFAFYFIDLDFFKGRVRCLLYIFYSRELCIMLFSASGRQNGGIVGSGSDGDSVR